MYIYYSFEISYSLFPLFIFNINNNYFKWKSLVCRWNDEKIIIEYVLYINYFEKIFNIVCGVWINDSKEKMI